VPEWTGRSELASASSDGPDLAVGVTENSEFIEFGVEGGARSLFHLSDPGLSRFVLSEERIVVSMKGGELLVYTMDGEVVSVSGPWPAAPTILAASDAGILVSIRKLLLLLTCDGREIWRRHLETEIAQGQALPGAFVIVDTEGGVHSVTVNGNLRRIFSTGGGTLHAFGDGGDGPGFLVVNHDLLTAVHPGGQPRWRFRAPKEILLVQCSADGHIAGIFTDIDLYLFPLTETAAPASAVAPEYLEIGTEVADG